METSLWPITISSWPLHSVRHCLCIPWLIYWKLHLKGPKTISNVNHLGAWNHDNLACLLGGNHSVNDDTRGLVLSLVPWFSAQVQHFSLLLNYNSSTTQELRSPRIPPRTFGWLVWFKVSDIFGILLRVAHTIPPNILIDIKIFCKNVCVY